MHEKEVSDIKDIIFAMEVMHRNTPFANTLNRMARRCTRSRTARSQQTSTASVTRSAPGTWKVGERRYHIGQSRGAARSTLKATLEAQVSELWDQFQAVRFMLLQRLTRLINAMHCRR